MVSNQGIKASRRLSFTLVREMKDSRSTATAVTDSYRHGEKEKSVDLLQGPDVFSASLRNTSELVSRLS